MTFEQIKENILMSEIYPDSGKINFGELSLETIYQWAVQCKDEGFDNLTIYDIESAKSALQEWCWSTGLLKKPEPKPLVFDNTVANRLRKEQEKFNEFRKRNHVDCEQFVEEFGSELPQNWEKQ